MQELARCLRVIAAASRGPEVARHANLRRRRRVSQRAPGRLAHAQICGLAGAGGQEVVQVAAFFGGEATVFAGGRPEPADVCLGLHWLEVFFADCAAAGSAGWLGGAAGSGHVTGFEDLLELCSC